MITLSTVLDNTQVSLVKHNGSVETAPPLLGSSVFIDPNADIYQQVVSYFEQLGYEIPPPAVRTDLISSKLETIVQQAKDLTRALKGTEDKTSRILLDLSADLASSTSGAAAASANIEDGRAHISQIGGQIENIHTNYQKKYGEIIKASTQYMQEMNTVIAKLNSYIKPGSDGKIDVDIAGYADVIDGAIEKYTGTRFNGSYNSDNDANKYYGNWSEDIRYATPLIAFKVNDSEAAFWTKKLEAQGLTVKHTGNEIKVYPDFKPIKAIYAAIKGSSAYWNGKSNHVMVQEFQSMQTAIDSQKNAINNPISRLLETFRQDNSHFDTLTQLLIQLMKDLHQYNNGLINM